MKQSKAAKITLTCSVCSKEFERLLCQHNNRKNKCKGEYRPVCSQQCLNSQLRKKNIMTTLICEECKKSFERNQIQIDYNKKYKKYERAFCSHRCFTIFKNKNQEKTEKTEPQIKYPMYQSVTKGDLFASSKNYDAARCSIQSHARKITKNNSKFKSCQICGYDKHCQVCHIKSVASFDNDALITDINAITNLMALCPNHHWEYDHNLLDTDYNSSPGGK